MTAMSSNLAATAPFVLFLLATASTGYAQSAPPSQPPVPHSRWSVEGAVGWDNGIAGHINSSAIGTLNNQAVVIKANTYEDVYGTGLHLRFGGAYALNDLTEVTGIFTFQSLDADQVVPMGDIGLSNLYGKYSDYQTFDLDVGLRRYLDLTTQIRAYGEGTIGLGFIDKTDITLVAPTANLTREANDFYDQTTAFAMGVNVGLLYQTPGRVGLFGQLGLRYMSGMSGVDDLGGTGLEDINNKSSRWTLPFVGGVRVRF